MAEFDYKQRPFSNTLTDAEYDRAVGRTPSPEFLEHKVYPPAEIPLRPGAKVIRPSKPFPPMSPNPRGKRGA